MGSSDTVSRLVAVLPPFVRFYLSGSPASRLHACQLMETPSRTWSLLVAVDLEAHVHASVWADGALLMPTARCQPPSDIIRRLMDVLSDFRDGDSISAVVHGPTFPLSAWTGTNVHLALHWIANTLIETWSPLVHPHAAGAGTEERVMFAREAGSGVRPKVSTKSDSAGPSEQEPVQGGRRGSSEG